MVVILAAVTLGPACLVDIDYSDTRFRCAATVECPGDQRCIDGICEVPGIGEIDAAPPPDAVAVDAPPPDGLGVVVFERRVLDGADDSEELIATGVIDRGSTDLELAVDNDGPQIVGIRFAAVDLPPGIELVGAHIQFAVDETTSEDTALEIRAEASDNARTLSTTNNDLSSRDTTEAVVTWEPPPWNTVGDAGPDQRTPDLTEVLAEILERPGWASGNAVAFLITGTGARFAEAFNGEPTLAPLLRVEYLP
jgi:hypothetical protein